MPDRARLALVTACGMVEDGVPEDDAIAAAAFAHDVTTAENSKANAHSRTRYLYMDGGVVRQGGTITPLELGSVRAACRRDPWAVRPPSPA